MLPFVSETLLFILKFNILVLYDGFKNLIPVLVKAKFGPYFLNTLALLFKLYFAASNFAHDCLRKKFRQETSLE